MRRRQTARYGTLRQQHGVPRRVDIERDVEQERGIGGEELSGEYV